jgi:cell division transport system permease protein
MLIGIVQAILAAPLARLAAAYDYGFAVHGLSLVQMLAALAASAALGWLGAFLAASRHIAQGLPR